MEALYDTLNFDFIRDIAPVASISRTPAVLTVTPSFPAETVPEFISYARANPGKINMASGGIGSLPHVAGELFKFMTGINLVHVPYRGSYLPDLLGGQVQIAFGPIPTLIEQIRAGKLRALAVTGADTSEALLDLPTLGQFVPGYEASAFNGVRRLRRRQPKSFTSSTRRLTRLSRIPRYKGDLLSSVSYRCRRSANSGN